VERRNVALILCLSLVWLSWVGLQLYLASKRPPVAADKPDEAIAQADGQQKLGEKPADKEARIAEPELKEQPAVVAERNAKTPEFPREWVALGSADPTSGFAGVFYFDNRGATVECVELNGKSYARDKKFKLTARGDMFDLSDAPFKEIPVASDTKEKDAIAARAALQLVLDDHKALPGKPIDKQGKKQKKAQKAKRAQRQAEKSA